MLQVVLEEMRWCGHVGFSENAPFALIWDECSRSSCHKPAGEASHQLGNEGHLKRGSVTPSHLAHALGRTEQESSRTTHIRGSIAPPIQPSRSVQQRKYRAYVNR